MYHVHTFNYKSFFKNHDGSHLVFSRWPKTNSVHPISEIRFYFKFEVDWWTGSKDIAFDGSHLD